MKIATCNIWNDNRGWPDRLEQICDEIKTQNADLLCLQDVPDEDTCKYIAEEGKYGFYSFVKHPSCELAILSKYPFLDDYSFGEAQIVNVKAGNYVLEVINVHLPWDSVLSCEKQVIALVNQNKKTKADYSVFCGDFNCEAGSSVQNFILGKQSLYGEEAVPYWEDLAIVYQNITGIEPEATLDLAANPRWKDHGYKPCAGTRIDWILLKYSYPNPSPKLKTFRLFGRKISPKTGYCPSDHYGVSAELDFDNI